jgi:hypothetical protein
MLPSVNLRSTGLVALFVIIGWSNSAVAQCKGTQCSSPTGKLFVPYIGAEGGGGWQHSDLSVLPPFAINGQGVVGGIYGGIFVRPVDFGFAPGFEIGSLFGNVTGSTAHPAASPTGTYFTSLQSLIAVEAAIRSSIRSSRSEYNRFDSNYRLGIEVLYLKLTAGAAVTKN